MSKNHIRIVSVIFGVSTFIFGCYYIHLIIYVQRIISFAPRIISFASLKMLMTNFVTLHLTLSAAILFLGAVSSFGIFKLRHWGLILGIVACTSYIVNFLAIFITQAFSPYFDELIYSKRGWFIFYHMNLRIDTFLVPLIVIIFLILFNLKVFRKNYHS